MKMGTELMANEVDNLNWVKGQVVGVVEIEEPLKVERGPNWFVLEVFAGCEEYFKKKIGETVWYPCKTVWKKNRKSKRGAPRREKKLYPLVAGYIFVNARIGRDPALNWIWDDRRLIGVLSCEGRPMPVTNNEITRMMTSEKEGHYDETVKLFSNIVGSVVEIQSGPFADKFVFVHELKGGKLHGDLIGSDVTVTISVSNLEKIGH